MPHIVINTNTGPASVHYTISTPYTPSSDKTNPDLPTAIFINPVYIVQCIFQTQFQNPQLRRFNLIALDSRGHVLSSFLVSPLPLKDPDEIRQGRQEIYDCWRQGFNDPNNIDESALLDAVYGALQLGSSGAQCRFIRAMNVVTIPQSMYNFAPTKFEEFHTTSIKFFANQDPHPKEKLQRIQGPVRLVACGRDIAYPVEFAQALLEMLGNAGAKADLVQVKEAPHFGHLTHPKE
ncbi:hypothetical protein Hypma_014162 [Hypsizygus marmoreus]|uniref:Peptidase S9 prolyl oligopeptidase catalytic domain-containing protein n=1 Tax=Hypsizygus marmoreus TaxID=39966 RepID=A0A369K8P3_HYPMA|nr:hypothetical protein Hypma_014162 [Hypsizygus marmoreus]